ncbi:MAG TPA: sulfatase-like hydrolase/transferase [Bacteroidales bacterium]|nr:sulfatase-like hydrolase/transferase [Bacteroidales bacterium]
MKQAINGNSVRRNNFISYSAIGISGLIIPSLFSCGQKKAEENVQQKPNIIVIIADDLGWNDIGYHNPGIKTPNIDGMMQQGLTFDRFYVCSVSSPTRASLLTGRYPTRYGILAPLGDAPGLPAGTVTIASLLKANGYDTGISGKWHLGTVPEARPLNYGFNSSYGYLRGQIDPYTHLYKNGSKTWHRNDKLFDEEGHATDLITNEAVRFISEPREKGSPFFLYVAYSVPHYPLEEPKEYTDMYANSVSNESRRNNVASITHMDVSIGKILNVLKEKGLSEKTVVMFLSDNGGQEKWSSQTEYGGKFKPHDVLGDNLPLRDWKGSLYDGALRVPAVMIWPGTLKPMKVEAPLSVTDIYPTLASFAGAIVSADLKLDGMNFMYAVNGGEKPKERILYWKSNNRFALLKGEWKLIHNGKKLEEGTNELYKIESDPYETKDLSQNNPDKVQELLTEMKLQLASDKTPEVKAVE